MKISKLFFVIPMVLSFSILFNGCANETTTTLDTTLVEQASTVTQTSTTLDSALTGQVSTATQTTLKLTLEDIKKRYINSDIRNIQNINTEYVLVESQQETFANRFDLYNLKTGEMDTLPTMPEYMTLEKIENENYFVFLSSGKNSECIFSTFPRLVRCFRVKNDVSNDNFTAVYEDKYFELEESVQAGSKAGSLMADLNITFDGLEVLFKPANGKEFDFYVDATDIPPTKTSYDENKRQMSFIIETNQLGENIKNLHKVKTEDNQYISSYEIVQKDDKIKLTANLRDTAKRYLIKVKWLPNGSIPNANGFTCFSVEFAGEE